MAPHQPQIYMKQDPPMAPHQPQIYMKQGPEPDYSTYTDMASQSAKEVGQCCWCSKTGKMGE